MPTAIYARKSTEGEDRQVQSLEDQIRELTRLADREGWSLSLVIEESRSAKAPDARPEFARLVREIEAGRIDRVLCWNISRLARNPVDGGRIAYLLQTGRLTEIRTSDRTYRPEDNALLLSIETGMATAYIQDLSRNVKRGMRGKFERGGHSGKAPVGYLNDRFRKEVVPDPERFGLMRSGWEMLMDEGLSVAEIHRRLVAEGLTVASRDRVWGPISRHALDIAFRSSFYTGEARMNGEIRPGGHPPMVTHEEFARAKRVLDSQKRPTRAKRLSFAYADLFTCSRCGCRITAERKFKRSSGMVRPKEYVYYRCTGARGCPATSVSEEALTEIALRTLGCVRIDRRISDLIERALTEMLERFLPEGAARSATLERSREAEERRLDRLTDLRLAGEIDAAEYARKRGQVLSGIAKLREDAHSVRETAGNVLREVRSRLSQARALSEERIRPGADYVGRVLREAGRHDFDLGSRTLALDPLLAKIAAFEPSGLGSGRAENGENSVTLQTWLAFIEDLRTLAQEEMVRQRRPHAFRAEPMPVKRRTATEPTPSLPARRFFER